MSMQMTDHGLLASRFLAAFSQQWGRFAGRGAPNQQV